jgi:hypothetical protein
MNKSFLYFGLGIVLIIGLIFLFLYPSSSEAYYGGYDASNVPIQEALVDSDNITISIRKGTILLTPLASYEITAKVQSKHIYKGDWSAKISPYDFALAWGSLVDKKLDKFIRYSQTSRFYMYRYKAGTPLAQEYISQHSANTHIIPASKNIRKALFWIRKKSMVKMEGYLVNVSGTYRNYPVHWNTSLVRTDTGNGACEIMYVTKLYYKNKMYE